MDVLMIIQKNYLNFSKQERKIADYILRFSHQIKNMNIAELAKNTGTSNASVTRFVKKIDCKSYADMKFHINAHNETQEIYESHGIVDEVFVYYQNVIKNTQRLIDTDQIEELVELLNKAKRIIVIGASNSGVTADIFRVRLMRMGLYAISYTDPLWMLMHASIAEEGDLYIAISNSGTTESILETVEKAKAQGAIVVSITSYSENPIAELSDLVFHVYNTRFIDNEKFTNSQFSNIYLIDVITTYLLKNAEFREKMFKTRESIGDI
jgi:DNA-binding MurR/RpiR family transcriptional regulator